MYSYSEALSILTQELAKQSTGESEYAIDEERSSEYDWGWVFIYDTKKYVETKDPKYALMGNAPILFNRESGEIRYADSTHGIEYYVAEYEAELFSNG